MLGVGDFYYELAVQIIEGKINRFYLKGNIIVVCLHTRERNGGLIEVNELCEYLYKKRGKNAQPISV
jgi:ESCRT-II complex subunit VPS22